MKQQSNLELQAVLLMNYIVRYNLGKITFDQLNDALIECSTRTGGFAEMALEASGGIKTRLLISKLLLRAAWKERFQLSIQC